jgi:hypothetical protein
MKHKLQKIPSLSAFTHYRRLRLRLHFKTPLGWALLGLLLLSTTPAQASLVKVESFWLSTSTIFSLETTAFLESTSFTGIGAETISVTSFDLLFIDNRTTDPGLFLTAELSPSNEVFIHFINGAVSTYAASRVNLDPGNTFFVINPSLGRLSREFPLVGQSNYTLQSGSVVTLPSAVPVPAAVWLFGTALIGFVVISRRTKVA